MRGSDPGHGWRLDDQVKAAELGAAVDAVVTAIQVTPHPVERPVGAPGGPPVVLSRTPEAPRPGAPPSSPSAPTPEEAPRPEPPSKSPAPIDRAAPPTREPEPAQRPTHGHAPDAEVQAAVDELVGQSRRRDARAASRVKSTREVTADGHGATVEKRVNVESALAGMAGGGGHAIRHLQGDIIPNSGSLASRLEAFKKIATPILESPLHTGNWRVGGTQGRAFLGRVDGRNVVIVVAMDGPHRGKVITSFIPDARQVELLYGR